MGPGKNSDVKYESFCLFIVGAAVARVLDSHGAVQTNRSALNTYDAFLFWIILHLIDCSSSYDKSISSSWILDPQNTMTWTIFNNW